MFTNNLLLEVRELNELSLLPNDHNFIIIRERSVTKKIAFNDIIMVKSDSNYSIIFLRDGKEILTSKTLKYWTSILEGNDFIRVHASYLINRNHILEIQNNRNILMNNNLKAAISRQINLRNVLNGIQSNSKNTNENFRKFLTFIFLAFLFEFGFSQSIGMGTTTPDTTSILDLSSTDKGFLIPRMTTFQRNDLTSPANGLLVFDTDKQTIYYYDGDNWTPFLFATDPTFTPSKKIYYSGDESHEFGASADLHGNYAIIGAPYWSPYTNPMGYEIYGKVFWYERVNGSWMFKDSYSGQFLFNNGFNFKFGNAVAIHDPWAVVGAKDSDDAGNMDEGRAFIFKRNGSSWNFFQEIKGSNATASDHFGYSVGIDSNVIVVGAPDDDIVINGNSIIDQGSVYVYEYNGSTWVQRAKLYDPEVSLESKMGYSVDVDVSTPGGYYILAGAPYKDVDANPQQGSAYIWGSFNDPTNWFIVNELTVTSGGNDDDNFGYSVSVDNGDFAVGAPNHLTNGKSFYYRWNGNNYQQYSLSNSKGISVNVSNGKIITENHTASPNGINSSGIADIHLGGVENIIYKKIKDADPQSNAQFGHIVRISGTIAMVLNANGHIQFTHFQD